MAQHPHIILNQSVKKLKLCIWVPNQKLEKGITHIVKTDLNLEIRDNDQTQEIGMSLEKVMKRQDQDMIDSKLQKGENSQTIMIDCGHPQNFHVLQDALCISLKHVHRIRKL